MRVVWITLDKLRNKNDAIISFFEMILRTASTSAVPFKDAKLSLERPLSDASEG